MNIAFNPTQPISKQQLGFGTKIEINTKTIKPGTRLAELGQIQKAQRISEEDGFNYVIKVKSPRDGMVVGQIVDPAGKTLNLADHFVSSGDHFLSRGYKRIHEFGLDDLGDRVFNIYNKALPIIKKHAESLLKK